MVTFLKISFLYNFSSEMSVLTTAFLSAAYLSTAFAGSSAKQNWYYDYWCNSEGSASLEYLDDSKCAKVFPSSFDRNSWSCPVTYTSDNDQLIGFEMDQPLSFANVDILSLEDKITNGASVCVIVTKRVGSGNAMKLYHKYYCAGEHSRDDATETWSSSKIFAIANAAGHLRVDETSVSCSNASETMGLDSSTEGKDGVTPLGDLATVVCSYDTTAGYSSNSLSSYFHDIGFRDRADALVANNGWLLGTNLDPKYSPQNQSLGGNYGEATPSDLGFSLTSNSADAYQCTVDKDPWPTVYDNSISSLSAAEMTRRIVQHREIPEVMRFPGMQWEDAASALYGAEESLLFPSLQWGGMSADTAIFLQSSLNMTQVTADSKGQFRIFSKLGAGWSTSREKGEIVSNAYACLPVLDNYNRPIPNQGYEFTVSVKGSIAQDPTLVAVEQQVHTAMQQTVAAIFNGELR